MGQPDFDLLLRLHAELGEGAIALRASVQGAVRQAQAMEDKTLIEFIKAANTFAIQAQAISQTACLAVGDANNAFDRLSGEADDSWSAD